MKIDGILIPNAPHEILSEKFSSRDLSPRIYYLAGIRF
jgi:hypothetical protein